MASAPTSADLGRVYLHGDLRVMLVNDRLVADQTIGEPDYQVAVKPVDPAPGPGGDTYPVALVDYRYLTETDERILPTPTTNLLDMPITNEAEARAFIAEVQAPLTNCADMTNRDVAEWAEANRTNAHSSGARLETVRLLREMCYSASKLQWDPESTALAAAILDTPVDELAAMVTMSDTVMGNWRTIAATLVPVV